MTGHHFGNTTNSLPLVMMALVAAGTLNSSAAYFSTAVNGASSGTLKLLGQEGRGGGSVVGLRMASKRNFVVVCWTGPRGLREGGVCARNKNTYTRNGNLGSDVSVILKETFDMVMEGFGDAQPGVCR